MKRRQAARKRNKNSVEDRGSFEKFKGGVTYLRKASWRVLKSSMPFWRSRILRKKSLDVSPAGFMVRGGAIGGPLRVYCVLTCGGGGCRTRYAGISTKKRAPTKGSTERR